jgi:glycine dehydrogenase subunit 1
MRYIPITDLELKEMLAEIGIERVDELFNAIPQEIRLKEPLSLPLPISEWELTKHLQELGSKACEIGSYSSFLGAGIYRHFIPSIVQYLTSRSEFYTTYTPYQPEISQGTLQAIYEFQTLICQLTSMEIANASLYDGASALAEAVLMAHRINHRKVIIISRAVHPEYRAVLKTYVRPLGIEIKEIGYNEAGITEKAEVLDQLSPNCSALILQNPNFFGCLEALEGYADLAHNTGAISIVVIAEPLSLGILKPPGFYGVDIVVGEGQSFGLPPSFGGPLLGFLATRERYLRNIPGRLVGETVDKNGRRGYVLTLATREQHIRRHRATSNICTNQSLCALAATIYLSTMGKSGLRELAILNAQKTYYAKKTLGQQSGYQVRFNSPSFNEFVLNVPMPPQRIIKELLKKKIIAGLDLAKYYPELGNAMLWCCTEINTKEEIDYLAQVLSEL